jgi:hypothetical protein
MTKDQLIEGLYNIAITAIEHAYETSDCGLVWVRNDFKDEAAKLIDQYEIRKQHLEAVETPKRVVNNLDLLRGATGVVKVFSIYCDKEYECGIENGKFMHSDGGMAVEHALNTPGWRVTFRGSRGDAQ